MTRAQSKKEKDWLRFVEYEAGREQRTMAKTYILDHAFQDSLIGETVSRTTRDQVLDFLASTLGDSGKVYRSAIPEMIRGEVLTDSRGTGSFQD